MSAVPADKLASLDPDQLYINFGRPGFVEDFRRQAQIFLLDPTKQIRASIDMAPLRKAADGDGKLQFWISLGKKGGGYVPLNPLAVNGLSKPGTNYELDASDIAPFKRRPRALQ